MIMSQDRKTNNGYIIENGKVVAWFNPNLKGRAEDYEEQIAELRAEIEALKQKQDKDELMSAHNAATADIDIQVNTKQVERAADQVKKEIDKALKNLF